MAAEITGLRDKYAPSGRQLYHLQFSFQAASPETFGYTVVCLVYEMSEIFGSNEFK